MTDAATAEIERPEFVIPADDDFSEDDMRLLTDEERAAILSMDDDDDDDDDNEGDDDVGTDDVGAVEAPVTDAAEPQYQARPPADAPDTTGLTEKLSAIEADRDKLMEQFEDGDLTRDEYKAKLAELAAAERDAVKVLAVAETQQNAIQEAFYAEVRGYAQAYPDLLDPTGPHIEQFDRHVRAVTGSEAYAHMSYRQMLEAAHTLYLAEAAILGNAAVPIKGPEAATPAEAAKPEAKRKRPEPPVTLAKVPAAAPVQVADGKFSALQQRIDTAQTAEEVERIMLSLSPEEAEAFASMDL